MALNFALLPLLVFAGSVTPVRPTDAGTPPDVSSFAGIDAALEGRVILAPVATWRYFPGDRNPAPKLEWTKKDFDDASWATGAAPFTMGDAYLGSAYSGIGTNIPAGSSALYLRRTLSLTDRAVYRRILLELPIDDGYVLFVNGKEEDRQHADKFGTYLAFDDESTSERKAETPPCPTIDLTKMLRDGVNTLAIQVLTHGSDRESLAAFPRIRAIFDVTPAGETERLSELRALIEAESPAGANHAARLDYLEARHRQRVGADAEAIAFLDSCVSASSTHPQPWLRLVETRRATQSLAALDAQLLERFLAGAHTAAMLDVWARFALEDLGMSPVLFAVRVPDEAAGLPVEGTFAEAVWSGRELAAGRPLRIDCGGLDAGLEQADAWGPDRCFAPGTEARALDGAGPDGSIRVCSRSLDILRAAYRIPVASGPYEVVLHFTRSDGESRAPGDAVFDVLFEGARVVSAFDPAAVDAAPSIRLPVFVRDGFLDVDLLPRTKLAPWVAGLEVQPVTSGEQGLSALRAKLEQWVDRTGRRESFPLVMSAECSLASSDPDAALLLLEEAEELPDFGPRDRELLGRVRDQLLPKVSSFATVDDLVIRRSGEADSILAAVRAADSSSAFVPYLEGRIHQQAGRLDEAIGGFEQLVFGDGIHPLPVLRMAECLAASKLSEEALGILEEAHERGVPRTRELLQLWLSLQLGPLERDPWDVVDLLAEMDVPDELIVVPTSKEAARDWNITNLEPPAIAWSRPDFNDSSWRHGPGMLGNGNTILGRPRSHSNKELVFGRQHFTLTEGSLLFPYFEVYANDAGECYLNGALSARINVATDGYLHMPVRSASFKTGTNLLGVVGFNSRDAGMVDAGIVQPLAELIWIKQQLDEGGALRINCGGGELTTADGKTWARDRFYGWAHASNQPAEGGEILGTESAELYATNRWFYDDSTGAFYQIPLPNGAYHVTLHFAEIDDRYAEAGSRTFDIRVEKQLLLDDLDVAGSAGFRTALVHEFDIDVLDGWLDLLINDLDHRSFISALEIEVRP